MNPAMRFAARCGSAALSGAVYALAYPPTGWGVLVVPGIAGLLLAIRGQSGVRAWIIGLLHGFTAYAIGLSWLWQIFGSMVAVLWCVLAVFTMCFAKLQSLAESRGLAGWRFAAFTAANWCGWEFIRAELFYLKFPWMTSGLALGPNPLLPWIGVYSVGAVVVLATALLVARRWKPSIAVFAALAAALLIPWKPESPANSLKVAGLQYEGVSLSDYLRHTRELPAGTDCVVWPEYAVPYDIRANSRDWKLVRQLCEERGITLTFGTMRNEETGGKWRNIALTLDPTGTRGEHTKVHTVHFFDDGQPGTTAVPVETTHGSIGTPVCFDCDYQGVVREMTLAGAEMFIVPIMDAESWTAKQQEQHAALFRIRACENGRWMFVCASSGVSQIIDPTGRVHGRLETGKQESLTGTIHPLNQLTFFTRYGWLTPWTLLAAAVVSWITLLIPKRKPA